MKRSSYEEGEYLGYDYFFITQIGDESLLVYEESYNEESQLLGTQELISLALPFPEYSFELSYIIILILARLLIQRRTPAR